MRRHLLHHPYTTRHPSTGGLGDVEHALELDDQAPVLLAHLVLEICLQGVDALTCDETDNRICVVKVAAVQPGLLLQDRVDRNKYRDRQ